MIVTHKVRMDLLKCGLQQPIDVMQDDQFSRKLEISLFSNGIPWTIPEDAAALVRYCKADKRGGAYDTLPDGEQAWAVKGNVLTVALAPQVMTDAGEVQMSVMLIRDKQVLNTFALALHVRPGVRAKMAESENYFNVTGFLPGPARAEVGRYLQVSAVDANGRVTGVKAVELPACSAVEVSGLDENLNAILNAWRGKTWYVLGDSISAEASLGAGHTTKLYHKFVQEYLGFGKVVNLARSGHSLGQNSTNPSLNVIGQLSGIGDDADLITIFAGVNDRWFNVPLGEPADTVDTTVYGALNTICTYLLENFSDRQLLFITPTKENHASCAAANTTGVTVEQIAEAVRERCAAYAIDCLDANTRSGIYPLVAVNASMFTSDKLHLNDNGHRRMAQLLTNYLLGKGSYGYTVPAEAITLNTDTLIFENASAGYQSLTAAVIPQNTTDVLSYESSDTSVATVNAYGAVFPKGAGSCVITAICGSVSVSCTVTVGEDTTDEGDEVVYAESISISGNTAELTVGETQQLTATVLPEDAADRSVTWTSSDKNVLTVADGLVTGVGPGDASVTAQANGAAASSAGLSATVSYTVTEADTSVPVTGVTLNAASGTLTEGDTVTLTATVLPADATNQSVAWKSSDENVAKVSDGVVTAIAEGSATITVVTADGGYTAVYELTVESAEEPFDINNYIGKTYTMTGTKWANEFHVALLLDGTGVAAGDNVSVKLSLSNLVNAEFSARYAWGYPYGSNTEIHGTMLTGTVAVLQGLGTAATEDDITVITQTANLINYTDGDSILATVHFALTDLPASFKLEEIEVNLPVIDFGSYLTSETFEIS